MTPLTRRLSTLFFTLRLENSIFTHKKSVMHNSPEDLHNSSITGEKKSEGLGNNTHKMLLRKTKRKELCKINVWKYLYVRCITSRD